MRTRTCHLRDIKARIDYQQITVDLCLTYNTPLDLYVDKISECFVLNAIDKFYYLNFILYNVVVSANDALRKNGGHDDDHEDDSHAIDAEDGRD